MKGRIVAVYKNLYRVMIDNDEFFSGITGKMLFNEDFPVVGDFVEISGDKQITEIFPRKSFISRKASGTKIKEQPIAANLDHVFIVSSLNDEFNINRMERYLTLVYDSGSNPVFILTKEDIGENISEKISEVEDIAFGVPIHVISSYEGKGLDEIREYLKDGSTISLVGSSGVGKSTLINTLLGKEVLETKEIRLSDSKGVHTTTTRELFKVNNGYIIDNPGMRELQLWGGSFENSFKDIEDLASECKFTDCSHTNEPGCNVLKGIEDGTISEKRLENYQKLQREAMNLENKANFGSKYMEKEKIKNMMGTLNRRKLMKNRK